MRNVHGPRLAPIAAAGLLLCVLGGCASAPVAPSPPAGRTPLAGWEGKLTTYDLESPVPGIASRPVTVLVPPGYSDPANASRRYPVLVLHDGNNCLDRDPFGHGGWQVHTVSYDLVQQGRMAPAILVLVDNTSSRAQEYVPGFGAAPGPSADGYLDFLTGTVLPFVETWYRTLPGPANRGIGGSSYGGILSLYAGWTRPQVFGFVMAMSTAFAYDFHALVRATPPPKKPLRIYIDSGTIDWGGGDDGMARTIELRDLLVTQGFVPGTDLLHFVGQGDNHSEEFWRGRLPVALPFLLPPGN
jgi:predicted alpha/beta superfamily hydrolase